MAQEIRTGIKLTGDASGMTAAFKSGERAVSDLDDKVSKTGKATRGLTTDMGGLASGVTKVAAAVGGWQLGGAIIRAADDMTTLQSRLKLVTGSASELAHVQGQLFQIAQNGRVSYSELGSTYAQIARATGELGISQDRLLGVTRTISQTMALSGGSADSMRAALIQLSQGLASGTLRGEELNSVMEQTPRLAQAIADGLGVPRGALRSMAEQGKITAEAVVKALEKSADSVRREFGSVAVTVSGAMVNATNSGQLFVAEMDRASGGSTSLAGAIGALSLALDAVTNKMARVNAESAGTAQQFDTFSIAADGLRVLLETIVVLGANVAYVLKQTGREIGGLAAQGAALLTGDFSGAAAIRKAMLEDAAGARSQIDAFSSGVLGARAVAAPSSPTAKRDFRRFEFDSQPGYYTSGSRNAATAGGAASSEAVAAERRLSQALAAERKAQLELSAEMDRQEIEQRQRTNEQLYRLGLIDVDDYYQRKADLSVQDIDTSVRAASAELVHAKALSESAKDAANKASAQARVLSIEKQLVELGGRRIAALEAPGAEAEAARIERENQALVDAAEDRNRRRNEAYADMARMEAETKRLNLGSIRDPRARAQAQLDAELQVQRDRIALITNDNTREEATERFNEFAVAKQLELNERLKPAWEQMLDGWRDSAQLMRETYDETMSNMLRDGEQAFVQSGGNLVKVAASMVNQLEQQLLRLVYRRYMAGAVESLGNSFLGAIEGLFGGGGSAATNSSSMYGLSSGGSGLGLQVRAGGGSYGPGLVLRGEHGPELSWENSSGYVFNASETRQMMAGGGSSNVTVKLINESGAQLQASQGSTTVGADGGLQVEVLLQAVEARVADSVAARSGPVSRALESGWGLRPSMA